MAYRVILTATAVKERKRLETKEQKRIDAILKSLMADPKPQNAKKLSGRQQDWRIRMGNYRILYQVDSSNQLVTIWRIAHRREAYR